MKDKKNLIVYVLIVLIVVAGLVFISFKKKAPENPTVAEVGTEQKINMDNNQEEQVVDQKEKATGEEGVKITVLKEGTGATAKSGDTVAMNYTGKLLDGTTFDSNVDPKFQHVDPFVFTIDGGQVIKGWDIGVAGMKEGEKRRLEIKPEFGYGDRAVSVIPANSTLIFEVELLGIKK